MKKIIFLTFLTLSWLSAQQSSGTGFYINSHYILTNHHVVKGCNQVSIFREGHEDKAKIYAYDVVADLALLKTEKACNSHLLFSPNKIKLGEDILALGYPLGPLLGTGLKVTKGIISSLTGVYNDSRQIQITAPIQPGNSGGPLLNTYGDLIGIIVAKLNRPKAENVNFAIKKDIIKNFLDSHNIAYDISSNNFTTLPIPDIVSQSQTSIVQVICSKPYSKPNGTQYKPSQSENLSINMLLRKGKDYYYGKNGVSQNYQIARDYFIRAAKQNSAEAFRFLGVIYLFAKGVKYDKTLAENFLKKAIILGDNRAKEIYSCYISDASRPVYKVTNLPYNETLNVRYSPTTKLSNIIDEIDINMKKIRVLETSINSDGTRWAKIKYCRNSKPFYGWVASRYLTLESTIYSPKKTYKVVNVSSNDTLNVRSGPGTEYTKITEIPPYASHIHIEYCKQSTKGGKWCKIHYKNIIGWVSSYYLR